MREFKFRAWDKNKKMFIHDIIEIRDWNTEDSFPFVSNGDVSSDWFELMQYTGLKDKNGVEIYEGDIAKWAKHSVGVVEEVQGCWSIKKDKRVFKLFGYLDEVEVIGNIYENEELLK